MCLYRKAFSVFGLWTLLTLIGCSEPTPAEHLQGKSTQTASQEDGSLNESISNLMNAMNVKYHPLKYEYNEDLLAIIDRIETRLSGKSDKLEPLPMPTLSEAEQLDHFRETIVRWKAATKRDLRAEIDALNGDVAARKPGEKPFHPEFQKKFSEVFDSFIPLEVAEIRERRNRSIHEGARPILEAARATSPEHVKDIERTLNTPPYNMPE